MMTAKEYASLVEREDFVPAQNRDLGIDKVYSAQSFWKDALGRFVKNRGAVFGLVMIVLIVVMAFAGPTLSGYDYRTQDMSQRNLPPHIAGWESAPIFSGVYTQYVNGEPIRSNVYTQKGIEDVTHIFGTDDFHRGTDIAAPLGTEILAAAPGTVCFAGEKGSYGNLIQVDHGSGYVTRYAHCSAFLAQEGDWVDQGQPVALVGSTGRSTGPHCHFEIRRDGEPVDAETLLP